MATRTVSGLPPDLTLLLFDLGTRRLVLVEGPSDRDTLREWYRDNLGEVEFYSAARWKSLSHSLTRLLICLFCVVMQSRIIYWSQLLSRQRCKPFLVRPSLLLKLNLTYSLSAPSSVR